MTGSSSTDSCEPSVLMSNTCSIDMLIDSDVAPSVSSSSHMNMSEEVSNTSNGVVHLVGSEVGITSNRDSSNLNALRGRLPVSSLEQGSRGSEYQHHDYSELDSSGSHLLCCDDSSCKNDVTIQTACDSDDTTIIDLNSDSLAIALECGRHHKRKHEEPQIQTQNHCRPRRSSMLHSFDESEPEDEMHDESEYFCSLPVETGDEQSRGIASSSSQLLEIHSRIEDVDQGSVRKDITSESEDPENRQLFCALEGKIDMCVKQAIKRKRQPKVPSLPLFYSAELRKTIKSDSKFANSEVAKRYLKARTNTKQVSQVAVQVSGCAPKRKKKRA